MGHPEIKSKLSEYIDGELPDSEKTDIRSHLSDCADCREEIERWQKVRTVFFAPGESETPSGFVDNVMDRIREAGRMPEPIDIGSIIRWFVPTVGVAFGILFFLSVLPVEGDASISTETVMLTNGNSETTLLEGIVVNQDLSNEEWPQIVWEE